MRATWLALLVAPAFVDSLFRVILALASRKWRAREVHFEPVSSVLVLVPARSEGAAVEPTLRSIRTTRKDLRLRSVLVLDGADPEAEAVALQCGAEVALKDPAGGSKGDVLRWAGANLREEIEAADAVFVLDVGSEFAEGFLDGFGLGEGVDGVQGFLSGSGNGPGSAAAVSERAAQLCEDCGREMLGWTVRLRGTGFALRPESFLSVVPKVRTQVEDLEMSLLLAASGSRLVMGRADAFVLDQKPVRVRSAARQRARWLAGQVSVPLRQAGALMRLVVRRPLEALGFAAEIGGRPLSLTIPLRVGVAAAILLIGPTSTVDLWLAGLIGLSAASDVLLIASRKGFRFRSSLSLIASWLHALILVPRAFLRWMSVRRS